MKILLAVPCMNQVPVDFMLSLMRLKLPGQTQLAIERNSLIATARNNLFFKAADQGYDWIFWLDSDMVIEPDTLLKLIETAEQGHDYVTALTFTRKFPCQPTICSELHWSIAGDHYYHGCTYYTDYPKDAVFPIAAAGCACLLMKTDLGKRVIDKYGIAPFDRLPCIGEDYSFCWRLNQLGIEMMCDSRVKPGHVGELIYNEAIYELQEGVRNDGTGT